MRKVRFRTNHTEPSELNLHQFVMTTLVHVPGGGGKRFSPEGKRDHVVVDEVYYARATKHTTSCVNVVILRAPKDLARVSINVR